MANLRRKQGLKEAGAFVCPSPDKNANVRFVVCP